MRINTPFFLSFPFLVFFSICSFVWWFYYFSSVAVIYCQTQHFIAVVKHSVHYTRLNMFRLSAHTNGPPIDPPSFSLHYYVSKRNDVWSSTSPFSPSTRSFFLTYLPPTALAWDLCLDCFYFLHPLRNAVKPVHYCQRFVRSSSCIDFCTGEDRCLKNNNNTTVHDWKPVIGNVSSTA